VSSRQQEKERRRRERQERERAAARAAARRRRLLLSFGGLLGVALVAGVVLALTVGFGGDGAGEPTQVTDSEQLPNIPQQQISDLEEAAKAAGCELSNPPYEGNAHVTNELKPEDYDTNPPTSGQHHPEWYADGIYVPGTTPELGKLVHPLEHGRIQLQYKPGTPARVIRQLEALVAETDGYHIMLFQNTTGMDAQIAATAWTHSLTCPAMNPRVFDAIRAFRQRYIDQGPEREP
jgi:hypothetical protein